LPTLQGITFPKNHLKQSNRGKIMKLVIKTVALLTPFLASTSFFASPVASIPDNIRPASKEKLSLTLIGKGMQIYQCKATEDKASEFEWDLKAPDANLFDHLGNKVGTHYDGPVWESNDGSKVWGKIKAKSNANKPNAVSLLLLSAEKTEGNGVFSTVTSIQRIDTVGGKTSTQNCNSTAVGQKIRIPYTATYNFYTAKP
jgi:hypothetical protein